MFIDLKRTLRSIYFITAWCTMLIIQNKDFHEFVLTLSWRRPLSYRNQSIDLQSKSMDFLLYDNGLRHERVNRIAQKSNSLNRLVYLVGLKVTVSILWLLLLSKFFGPINFWCCCYQTFCPHTWLQSFCFREVIVTYVLLNSFIRVV